MERGATAWRTGIGRGRHALTGSPGARDEPLATADFCGAVRASPRGPAAPDSLTVSASPSPREAPGRPLSAPDAASGTFLGDAEPVRLVAVADSAGLRAIRHLERFVGVSEVLAPAEAERRGVAPDVALVWGRKDSGRRTLDFAAERGLPVWYLEDGWVRTCSADAHSRTTYSLLVDEEGVYYDAGSPSAIESFLADDVRVGTECDAAVTDRARRWREALVDAGTTKYNWYRRSAGQVPCDPFVLVVDQTADDASVACGGMDAKAFADMLDAAVDEHPDERIVVRTHPDVVAGRREGYLSAAARRYGLDLVPGDDDPYRWLVAASNVHVGTSQLGYEALLAERPVTAFGAPFYAGWGLTEDRSGHPALVRRASDRAGGRTIDELFHAAHVRLARYRSPIDGSAWSLGDCLDHVALQRREFARNAKRMHCVGITPWKRRYVERFLRSPDGRLSFGGRLPADGADAIVTWSFRDAADGARGDLPEAANDAAHASGVDLAPAPRRAGAPTRAGRSLPVWRLEDGFLRSAGLGSDFTAPGSLVLDTSGLYFDPGAPSDLETLLNEHDCRPGEIQRASRLRRRVLDAGVSKYSTGQGEGRNGVGGFERPGDRRCVLVVGQVEDDESIERGCAAVSTNNELLQAARKACPDAWIVYRPHPDVASGNRRGAIDPVACAGCADAVVEGGPIGPCIDAADEVHVMTSLTGFEALMRGRAVVTWGAPFYAGWGLTEDRMAVPRRRRRRTLDELVYLALIEYPRYVHIDSGEFVTAETMVSIIEADRARAAARPARWGGRPLLKLSNIVKGLSYAP